ncbi:MAG: DUF1467 family protein [Beijerinckiaceae bacterium]
MPIGSLIAIYFVIWWIILFAVLPFGVRSQVEEGKVVPGSEPGAPVAPKLVQKAIWTSVLAAVLTALVYIYADVIVG